MWDLPKLVRLQKARNALKDGRLDEAFDIAQDKKLRDYRECQVLLEKMVRPLLERAREHLGAGRPEDALADVERAQEAGGNRPETATVRQDVLGVLERVRMEENAEHRAANSARRHLDEGRLDAGSERLRDVAEDSEKAGDLRRRVQRLREEAREAQARVESCLKDGDVERALEAFRAVVSVAAEDPETRRLSDRIIQQAGAAVSAALNQGEIERARRILRGCDGTATSDALSEWRDTLSLCDKVAGATARRDWAGGRVYLRRLARILPDARWIALGEKQMKILDEALRDLRSGPLGEFASGFASRETPAVTPASAAAPEDVTAARRAASDASAGSPVAEANREDGRFLLWVDGVGSYLLLRSDSTSIGRLGSSLAPDIELAADLEGVHAQILRVDHDYFAVARGAVSIAEHPVERHLLADGDEIVLGSRSGLSFRLPTSLSTTALLKLGTGLRLSGDVHTVILLDGHLIFGEGSGCHIDVPKLDQRVILSCEKNAFRCRSPVPIVVDGKIHQNDASIPLGAHVEAGQLTFTLTAVNRQGDTT